MRAYFSSASPPGRLACALTFGCATPTDWALYAVSVAFLALRFIGLEHSPPGFFSDEFRGALHQICLGEATGISGGRREMADNFVPGAGGGLYTPPFLYLGALWQKIWGPSIASSRAMAALFGGVSAVGAAAIAARVGGRALGRWVLLAASLSPAGFQFSRIAWDPPLAAGFLVLGVLFWLGRQSRGRVVLSAMCVTLALYCYPPTRIQAPLVFLVLFAWALHRRTLRARHLVVFAGVCLAAGWKLIAGTLDGSLNRRGAGEAIWAPAFVQGGRGRYSSSWFVVQTFLDNLHAHFRPSYLFLRGDENLRHSSQWFGELGLVDDLALVVAAVAVGMVLYRRATAAAAAEAPAEARLAPAPVRLAVFGVIAFGLGVIPAALCWSGVPHALRSIGAWPFLALTTGTVLCEASRRFPPLRQIALGVALLNAGWLSYAYFVRYPKLSGDWFDVNVERAMLDPTFDPVERARLIRAYPEGFRYYAIVHDHETCLGSEARLARWMAEHPNR